jgi:hypothetical protein
MATFNATKIAEAVLRQIFLGNIQIDEKYGPTSFEVERTAELIRQEAGDCLSRCQDDEPIFVLCARDVTAPAAVHDWATRVQSFPDPDPIKVRNARECADLMAKWPGKKKLPGTTKNFKEFVDRD